MPGLVLALGLAFAASAEMRDEEHLVGDRMVRITRSDLSEIMTVGLSGHDQVQVLSGADIELVPFVGDGDSIALIGQPVIVAEVTGTHSCDEGDARAYWVVTLGEVPMPEGPLTTCRELTVTLAPGAVMLDDGPMGQGEHWSWSPGQGFSSAAN